MAIMCVRQIIISLWLSFHWTTICIATDIITFALKTHDSYFAATDAPITVTLWFNHTLILCDIGCYHIDTYYSCTSANWTVLGESCASSPEQYKVLVSNMRTDNAVRIEYFMVRTTTAFYGITGWCANPKGLPPGQEYQGSCSNGHLYMNRLCIDFDFDGCQPFKQMSYFDISRPNTYRNDSPWEDATTATYTVKTCSPTLEPTYTPTTIPTLEPTTSIPTQSPSKRPTLEPTVEPTNSPTFEPTVNPTLFPSVDPTPFPSDKPTRRPTLAPQPTFPIEDIVRTTTTTSEGAGTESKLIVREKVTDQTALVILSGILLFLMVALGAVAVKVVEWRRRYILAMTPIPIRRKVQHRSVGSIAEDSRRSRTPSIVKLKIPDLPEAYSMTESEAPGSPEYQEIMTDVTDMTPREELSVRMDVAGPGSPILGVVHCGVVDEVAAHHHHHHHDITESEPAHHAEEEEEIEQLYRPVCNGDARTPEFGPQTHYWTRVSRGPKIDLERVKSGSNKGSTKGNNRKKNRRGSKGRRRKPSSDEMMYLKPTLVIMHTNEAPT